MHTWPQLRAEFPALTSWTYLDTASFGQVPKVATEAVMGHLKHRDETASSQFLSWFDEMDGIRELVGRLIQCTAADIAFVPSASTGLAYLMQGLDWKQGDEILTLKGEFPNQLYQNAAAERWGIEFRTVAWPEFFDSVGAETRVVLMSTVNYATGFRPPVAEVARFLRERGILLYLDGTQSVGALEFDVQDVQPSMLCVDAYKWMLSPNGAGFVYIEPALRKRLTPTVVGWRSDAGWRNVGSLNHGTPVFAEDAQKYEGGMIPFPSLYGLGAVVRLLLEVGPAVIEKRVRELAAQTRAMLVGLGAEVNADESQIVTGQLPRRDSSGIATSLKERRIMISARHGKLRVSPHFYNNEADIAELRDALQQQL